MNSNFSIFKQEFYMKEITNILKPKRKQLLKSKDSRLFKADIPTLKQAERVDENFSLIHNRQKSQKKKKLFSLFEENITLFCRLNTQKSNYQKLFSKSKENEKPRRKLKRCTSAKLASQVARQDQLLSRQSLEEFFFKRHECLLQRPKRPFSCKSMKHQSKLTTMQSDF